ncbi:MAG TPA: hypothetical protein VK493_03955 [Bryobacteraceae bacterium]|nr:hypothetical protein [Bryobacteraceae bacterium]
MDEAHLQSHHYVPRWYQKRFLLPGQNVLCYLDLKPETIIDGNIRYTKKDLWYWHPSRCFCIDDLYSMRFGRMTTDMLERHLFGAVDRNGATATEVFGAYDDFKEEIHEAFRSRLAYVGAQRFRTPRGLDWIKRWAGVTDQTATLMAMSSLFQAYDTMWAEGIWEIAHARKSVTKFIISDDPVTFFNRRIFPAEAAYPGGEDFPKIGTRTIFALSMDCCLIITHLQLVRNPWLNPLEPRENARNFGDTMFNLTDIQFGRELEEEGVLRINHILKSRATKFIAAGDKEWLYPERNLDGAEWAKLDNDWFLLPNLWKVGFTTGIIAGYKDGSSFVMDEYGRNRRHPRHDDRKRQNEEFRTLENAKREWAKKRIGKSLAQVIDQMRENTVADKMMGDYLREQGLLAPDIASPLLNTHELLLHLSPSSRLWHSAGAREFATSASIRFSTFHAIKRYGRQR